MRRRKEQIRKQDSIKYVGKRDKEKLKKRRKKRQKISKKAQV